jgi:hypothetical protein
MSLADPLVLLGGERVGILLASDDVQAPSLRHVKPGVQKSLLEQNATYAGRNNVCGAFGTVLGHWRTGKAPLSPTSVTPPETTPGNVELTAKGIGAGTNMPGPDGKKRGTAPPRSWVLGGPSARYSR